MTKKKPKVVSVTFKGDGPPNPTFGGLSKIYTVIFESEGQRKRVHIYASDELHAWQRMMGKDKLLPVAIPGLAVSD